MQMAFTNGFQIGAMFYIKKNCQNTQSKVQMTNLVLPKKGNKWLNYTIKTTEILKFT